MALSNAYKLIILIFINYIGLNAIPTSLERSLMVISKLKMIMTLLLRRNITRSPKEINRGRIRYIGLSNETPWGTMKFLQLAENLGVSKFVSVQNPYSLLNRTYEIGMSEIAKYEGVGLLAYSPLAFGYLTGKFRNGARPANARVTLFPRFSRYSNPQSEWATEQYAQLAENMV